MPLRRSVAGQGSHWVPYCGVVSFLAMTVCFSARSDAAWALLRPSARLSAKFANSTVNHSHRLMAKMKAAGASPLPRRASSHSSVVMIEPM